ncbi:MAG: hypothetical protein ACREPR_19845 [Brasilonema sp.]
MPNASCLQLAFGAALDSLALLFAQTSLLNSLIERDFFTRHVVSQVIRGVEANLVKNWVQLTLKKLGSS